MNEGFKACLSKIAITVPDLFVSVETSQSMQENMNVCKNINAAGASQHPG